MIGKLKILCGILALILAIYNLGKNVSLVGIYWIAVTIYWATNYLGG